MITLLLRSPLLGQYSHFIAAIGTRSMKLGSRGLLDNPRLLFIILIWVLCRENLCSADPCDTTQNGDVPNPDDPTCITYYNCWDHDIDSKKTCPVINGDQHLFNPATGYCDWPDGFSCNGGSGPTHTVGCVRDTSEQVWICNGR